MEYMNIRYQLTDGVARITLNHPPLNILNIAVMKEINSALEQILEDKSLKMLVFDAEGKAFSAGVDVSEHLGATVNEMIKVFHDIFRNLMKLKCPVLAAVNGAALGGGCELVAFCDFIIASENAKFGQPEIQVGVFPPIACILLPKIISHTKGMEMLLTGCLISGKQAESIGLVNKCVPENMFKEEVNSFIAKITHLSPLLVGMTKSVAIKRQHKDFTEYLAQVEDVYLNQLMKTEDAQEGLKAFLDKRKPEWKNK